MKNLYYRLYLKYYEVPHPKAIGQVIERKEPTNQLKRQVSRAYSKGLKIDKIAEDLRISRERVKQILFSVLRDS